MTESEKPGIEKRIKPSGLVLETVALTSVCLSNSRTFINMTIYVLEALLIEVLALQPIISFCLKIFLKSIKISTVL